MSILTQETRTVKVYFSNGVSTAKPWHVGTQEGHAIVDDLGSFPDAESAIAQGAHLANQWQMALDVPVWVQRIADRAQQRADDLRYNDLRENDAIGVEECAGGLI